MAFPRPHATTRDVTGIPTGKLATWWVVGSEIVIFGGLLMSYLMLRLFHDSWTEQASHTNTWAGALNTFVLLTSSLFMVLAHQAVEAKQLEKAFRYIWMTIGGGAVFLVVKAFEWNYEISNGYTWGKSLFWGFYYTAAGLHALHVIGGMVIMAIIAFDARKNINPHRVELIGIYWHFVDIVWIFLFPLLYIAK